MDVITCHQRPDRRFTNTFDILSTHKGLHAHSGSGMNRLFQLRCLAKPLLMQPIIDRSAKSRLSKLKTIGRVLLLLPLLLCATSPLDAQIRGFDVMSLVRKAASGPSPGVRRLLDSMAPREVTLNVVADAVLRQNYNLLAAHEVINATHALITQREAAFNISLNGSLSASTSKTKDRIEIVG